MFSRAWFCPQTFLTTLDDQLSSQSGVYGFKDLLWSADLRGSFDGQIYTYWSVLKSKFVHQRTQEDEHYRENPSNHELLTVRGVDRRAFLKMFRAQVTVYCTSFKTWSHNTIQHDFLLLLRPVATQYIVHYYHRPRNGIYLTLWYSCCQNRRGI